jgi:ERCC4-type nuclease
MEIYIDARETLLIDTFKKMYPTEILKIEMLELGDVQFRYLNEIQLILERKTMNDIASSIHDGRWKEQKLRITSNGHSLFYLIQIENESEIFEYENTFSNIPSDNITSAILNLWVNMKIPFIFLKDIENMTRFIFQLSRQYLKKNTIYSHDDENNEKNKYNQSLIQSISTSKKKNITADVYFLYCLQGIPNISKKTSKIIQEHFQTITQFFSFVNEYPKEEFPIKLNKNVLQNIYQLITGPGGVPPDV